MVPVFWSANISASCRAEWGFNVVLSLYESPVDIQTRWWAEDCWKHSVVLFFNPHPRVCLESKRGRERIINRPDQERSPHPRYVPCPGIRTANPWCTGWCSNQLSHPDWAKAFSVLLHTYVPASCPSPQHIHTTVFLLSSCGRSMGCWENKGELCFCFSHNLYL